MPVAFRLFPTEIRDPSSQIDTSKLSPYTEIALSPSEEQAATYAIPLERNKYTPSKNSKIFPTEPPELPSDQTQTNKLEGTTQ